MIRSKRIVLGVAVLLAVCVAPLGAQYNGEPDDNPKINSNLGFTVGVPLGTTGQVVDTAWGVNTGVGFNFDRRNGFVGEFMWNRLYPDDGLISPLRAAALQVAGFNATTDLFALTGNYRFELRGKKLGGYAIGGGGWYHRNTNLSKAVVSGTATTCTPVWLWWGFTCSSGVVVSNQTIIDSSASTWGGNAGLGFTARVGDAPYRFYAETRYHYAPFKNINARFLTVTFGIRY
jgi:Outer membrane protein beta-barrel domain